MKKEIKKLESRQDRLLRIDKILLQYALKLKELADAQNEITLYIEKYDNNDDYEHTNHLMTVYKGMYDSRKNCYNDDEYSRIAFEDYSIMNFYEESEFVTYKEVE
jgi:hypothetical protein